MIRALGVDFGSKRIGLAVGIDEPFVATTPQSPISASGSLKRDADAINILAKRHEVDVVVVGIPENLEDDRMARVCRKLAEEIRSANWTVIEVDETMTSVQAETNLRSSDLTAGGRRKRRDGEAACLILERFFGQESS